MMLARHTHTGPCSGFLARGLRFGCQLALVSGLWLVSSACDGQGSDGGGSDGGGSDGGMVGDGSMQGTSAILRTSGRHLLDRCGNHLVIRGVEQLLGNTIPAGNDWDGIIDQIAASGSNAVRILPDVGQLSVSDLDAVLARVAAHDMVVFISPGDRTWFGRTDVKTLLATYQGILIIDAFQEPNYDDRPRWFTEATAAIDQVRGYGYEVPITVLANVYGRDLPSVLMRGAEIVAHDPEHNVILGWQAYWDPGGWYEGYYKMTVTQGIEACAAAAFPIQVGIDDVTDPPSTHMDYQAAMTAAQANGVGWLWWNWYNPYGPYNNLSTNGTASSLTSFGQVVVDTHPASLMNSSVKACRPQ